MSYCRFSEDCDVYLISNDRRAQVFLCCGCLLRGTERFQGYPAVIEHITDHERAGHKVPPRLVEWLKAEEKDPPESIVDRLRDAGFEIGDPLGD